MQNAPGRHYREGISLIDLFNRFPNETAAEAWFESERWGETGLYCPRCGGCDRVKPIESRKPMPYWCGDCRQRFSVRTGTLMERSKIPLHKWAIAVYIVTTNLKSVSSMKLHRDLGITQKSAWFMLHRIRQAYELTRPCWTARSRWTRPTSAAKSTISMRAKSGMMVAGPLARRLSWASRIARPSRCGRR